MEKIGEMFLSAERRERYLTDFAVQNISYLLSPHSYLIVSLSRG